MQLARSCTCRAPSLHVLERYTHTRPSLSLCRHFRKDTNEFNMERMNRLHWHCTSGKWRVSFKFKFFHSSPEIVRFKNLGMKLLPNFFIYFIVDSKLLHSKRDFLANIGNASRPPFYSKSNFHSRTIFENFIVGIERIEDSIYDDRIMRWEAGKRNRWHEAKHNHWRERIGEKRMDRETR